MWNGFGWYGFIGVITTSTTDISLKKKGYSRGVIDLVKKNLSILIIKKTSI